MNKSVVEHKLESLNSICDKNNSTSQKKTNKVTINDFEKITLLGMGSCGCVYLVKNKTNQHTYAMKILKKDNNNRKKVTRAITEQEILAQANHPFVSKLFFCFQTQLNLYIVMQYCAGGDFYSVIKRQPNGCLTEPQTKFYASCVLLALEYLHFHGIIYRDLKPENMLMHASGHIVLTDFDLSICSHQKATPRSIIKPYTHCSGVCVEPNIICNEQVGTAEYMAPEIIAGENYGPIVDWWSFGILIFEMLFGVTPFRGINTCSTFKLIRKCHFEFPSHTPHKFELHSKVKNLIKHLLVRKPGKRLGFTGGSSEIKDHPYFQEVDFQLLKSQKPPIIPELSGNLDSHYFDPCPRNSVVEDTSEIIDPSMLKDGDMWKAFTNIDHSDSDPNKL